jgi:hypothetical protein
MVELKSEALGGSVAYGTPAGALTSATAWPFLRRAAPFCTLEGRRRINPYGRKRGHAGA